MDINRVVLKAANSLLNTVMILALCVAGAYSTYALWDNNRVYAAAENVQADMIKLKPQITEEAEDSADFSELLAVNEDVCAWVTLDNTGVDYPVLQGETNLSYINTDVYGQFALAGSIYLDSRNDRNFSDTYSLLYGHHMENSRMFGDLDLYKDEDFFKENKTGTLILPDRIYKLEIFSCLVVSASEEAIFNPLQWQGNIEKLLKFTSQNSLNLNEDVQKRLENAESKPQILALSTCSTEFTDARTIVLAVMESAASVEMGGEK